MVLLPWVGGSGSSVPWVLLTLTWVRGLSVAGSGHIGCNHARIPIKAEGDFAGKGRQPMTAPANGSLPL